MVLSNIYSLLRYYTNNKLEIIESIKKRECNINIQNIDKQIEELKSLNNEFANVCKEIKNCICNEERKKLKQTKSNIGGSINKYESKLKFIISTIPNMIDKSTIKDDIIVKQVNNNRNKGIEFTKIINSDICMRTCGRNTVFSKKIANHFFKIFTKCIDHNNKGGFDLIITPSMIEIDNIIQSMHYNNFKDNLFHIDKNKILVPTGECQLVSYVNNLSDIEICNKEYMRLQTFNNCYRNEDAATSKMNKPIVRQSEFIKVEIFSVCRPEISNQELNYMLDHICSLINSIGLNYRIVKVGAKNMSPIAYLTYDIECYLPVSNVWLEVVSLSNCLDIQSSHKTKIHYLNGTCLAINRIIASMIEQGLIII